MSAKVFRFQHVLFCFQFSLREGEREGKRHTHMHAWTHSHIWLNFAEFPLPTNVALYRPGFGALFWPKSTHILQSSQIKQILIPFACFTSKICVFVLWACSLYFVDKGSGTGRLVPEPLVAPTLACGHLKSSQHLLWALKYHKCSHVQWVRKGQGTGVCS